MSSLHAYAGFFQNCFMDVTRKVTILRVPSKTIMSKVRNSTAPGCARRDLREVSTCSAKPLKPRAFGHIRKTVLRTIQFARLMHFALFMSHGLGLKDLISWKTTLSMARAWMLW